MGQEQIPLRRLLKKQIQTATIDMNRLIHKLFARRKKYILRLQNALFSDWTNWRCFL